MNPKQLIFVGKDLDRLNRIQRKARAIDKELGIRYRGFESNPGESFKEFKRRVKPKQF